MAAASPHSVDGADGSGEGEVPPGFRRALADLDAALEGGLLRPELLLTPMPAPRRLAPYSHALDAVVVVEGEQLADGRFVLLHDPAGQAAWQGAYRVVTLTRAEVEPEIATDPLLPEVIWSWLTSALAARAVPYREPSGTVTRADSHYFGRLAERPRETRVEMRASWTAGPVMAAAPGSGADESVSEAPAPETPVNLAGHLAAWCDLLCQCAGLPPHSPDAPAGAPSSGASTQAASGVGGRVVPLPKRRGPQGP